MMTKLSTLLFLLSLTVAQVSMASPVSRQQARQTAAQFMARHGMTVPVADVAAARGAAADGYIEVPVNLWLINHTTASGEFQACLTVTSLATNQTQSEPIQSLASRTTYIYDDTVNVKTAVRLASDAAAVDRIAADATTASTPVFDLQGRRISGNARRGLYISGDKKIIINK